MGEIIGSYCASCGSYHAPSTGTICPTQLNPATMYTGGSIERAPEPVEWKPDPIATATVQEALAGVMRIIDMACAEAERRERLRVIAECARVAEACDKSTHPAEVADRIRALATDPRTD